MSIELPYLTAGCPMHEVGVSKKEEWNSPLHPERMSIPIICQTGMHDIIFHVIFGHDSSTITEFVQASAGRLHSIVKCQHLANTICHILDCQRKGEPVAIDTLKAMFFLLLNVDIVLKTYVCDTANKEAFAAAMNSKQNVEGLDKLHAWSMMGTRPICKEKAINFFVALHEVVVKKWLQDERKGPTELLEDVKDKYLIS